MENHNYREQILIELGWHIMTETPEVSGSPIGSNRRISLRPRIYTNFVKLSPPFKLSNQAVKTGW